jgi:type I restriction enzyme S subunit
MTPALEHFELLAEAGGGIERLRELIFDLAVRGRLLPTGTSHWKRAQLGEVVEFAYGKALPERDRTTSGNVPVYGSNGAVGRHDQALVYQPCLVVGRKGSSGSIHCVMEPCWPIDTTYFVTAPPGLDLKFLFVLLRSLRLERLERAIAIPGLNRNEAYAQPLLLPPLAEQQRIVAKVDELMRLLDAWESRRAKQRALQTRVRSSALNALVSAQEPEAFSAAWRQALEHFEVLFERPEDVQHLRELVLHAAMSGALTRPEPDDGTSGPLLGRLESERQRMRGRARVKDALPPVSPAEEPYRLPSSWRWCRLGHFGGLLGGGTPSKANAAFWSGSIPWVSPKDMKRSLIDDAEDHISDAAAEQSAVKRIPTGSLLFVVRGMILAHAFPVALTAREVTINQDMKALVLALPEMGPYLLWACKAARARILQQVERSSHGTCRLDTRRVQETPIPLPPLPEQRRIVSRLESLMRQCDELEFRLRQADQAASKLTESMVAGLVAAPGAPAGGVASQPV